MTSPLLANIVLDVLDKELAKHGHIFVRYADDFLVLAKSTSDIEKALNIVQNTIENVLILKLEPDKTKVTTFKQGFDFFGFTVSTNGVSMKADSVKKLKDKVRKLTIRSHNFSGEVIEDLNRVTKRTANYFATDFSTVNAQFLKLDEMIRRRLRCMKKKRISVKDNLRIPNRFFQKKGLVSLYSFVSKNEYQAVAKATVLPTHYTNTIIVSEITLSLL